MTSRAIPPASSSPALALIIIVSGPGGVGKGTIVDALLQRDQTLLLSRSWTTRSQRPGEKDEAYVFTTREKFESHEKRPQRPRRNPVFHLNDWRSPEQRQSAHEFHRR